MNKRLFRDTRNGKIGGVCSGLAEYFGTDVVFFRALFLISIFFGGLGCLAYLILWLITPEKPNNTKVDHGME